MKKVNIHFYSHKPRLRVSYDYTTDIIPRVGEYVTIQHEFMSEWDKTYFNENYKKYKIPKTFLIKEIHWMFGNTWWDVNIMLTWTEEEQNRIDKFLKKTAESRLNSLQILPKVRLRLMTCH